MAYVPLTTLIDKNDTFELVRDQIGAILALESANQITLAIADGKTAAEADAGWKLRVYLERSNPWEQFLNADATPAPDLSPVINVWFSNADFPKSSSNTIEEQKSEAVMNIDCYGYGQSADDAAGGHIPGDRLAAFEAQRALRLVRNIIMAGPNTYLQMRANTNPGAPVWGRWPQSITSFQPELDVRPVGHVVGLRLALRVDFTEFSPQVEPETLELLSVDIHRALDGMLIAEADFDYTAP